MCADFEGREDSGSPELIGRSDVLRAHIEYQNIAAQSGRPGLPEFVLRMGSLLADRIDEYDGAVTPLGYLYALKSLVDDCQSGTNCFTQEAMPPDVTGRDDNTYIGFRILADRLAVGAFGEEFLDELRTTREAEYFT